MENSQRALLVCIRGASSPVEMLARCLHKNNLDRNSNITEITMVVEDCIELEVDKFGELLESSSTPIDLKVGHASLEQIAENLQDWRNRGVTLSQILPAKNRTDMLESCRSLYIAYLDNMLNSNSESAVIMLDTIWRECHLRIERWNRFRRLGVDFVFLKEELAKLIRCDSAILDATYVEGGVSTAITNAIRIIDEMLGPKISPEPYNPGDNLSQIPPVKLSPPSPDLKEVAEQFMREYESFDTSAEAKQFHTSVSALVKGIEEQVEDPRLEELFNQVFVSLHKIVDAEKWAQPLKTLKTFLELDGAKMFMGICRVPKVDASLTLLRDEVADFEELISLLEEYKEIKSADAKVSLSKLEQWVHKFVSFKLGLLEDPRSHQVVNFFLKLLLEWLESGI